MTYPGFQIDVYQRVALRLLSRWGLTTWAGGTDQQRQTEQ
jgi:hypothetical protein